METKVIPPPSTSHPIAFLFSLILLATGIYMPHIRLAVQSVEHMELPMIFIQVCQCIAYLGAGVTGYVAGHGWLEKKGYLPRKKKGKKK